MFGRPTSLPLMQGRWRGRSGTSNIGTVPTTSQRSSRRNAAVLFALASMTSAQLGAALSRPYFHQLGSAGVVWIRLLFAGAALLLYSRPSLTSRTRRELLTAVALGVASGVLMLAFFAAIARIPLGIAVAIEFLGPLGVALAGSRRLLDGLWIALAAGGIALLTLGHPTGGTLDLLGVLLALGAAAGWAAYIVLTQRVGGSWPGIDGLAVSLGVAAVVTAPFGLAGGPGRFAHPSLLLAGLGLAVLLPLAPFLLEFAALRRLPDPRLWGAHEPRTGDRSADRADRARAGTRDRRRRRYRPDHHCQPRRNAHQPR